MASYTTSEKRHDHVAWICNSLMPDESGNVCSAGNEVTETICRNCGKEIQDGAEALNDADDKIGMYEGSGMWRYEGYTNGTT